MKDNEPQKLFTLTCRNCEHRWIPRTEKPDMCPNCKTRAWEGKEDEDE